MKTANRIALAALAALLCLAACSSKGGGAIRTAQDLNGKRIGVRSSSTSESWASANLPSARIVTYSFYSDSVADLSRGAIDAVIVDDIVARELIADYDDIQILTNVPSFSIEDYGIGVRKGNPELLDAVNAALATIRQSGEYDLLYSSFIEPPDGNITIPSFDIPASERTIRLGTDPGFAPFGYTVDNEIVGFDISLGQLIGRELGVNIEIVGMNFQDLIGALAVGGIDMIAAGMTITEERKKIIDFSVPYFTTEQVIILKK